MTDQTVESFPTYADLTCTQAWAQRASGPVNLPDSTQVLEDPGLVRYTESTLLGVGGMGKVVLAHDARIGREVAVKQLHTDRELTADQRARFIREARVQGQLEHPSIVPVYDIDERSDGTTFFTMRRVLGRTLHAILDDLKRGDAAVRARYTRRELLTAFATVCLTIDYAHSRGVIHRDLKPANIMLGDFGEVYVLDWGVARIAGETVDAPKDAGGKLSVTGEMMGTPLYMAPEQMVSPDVGPAADVFALGAMLFEILTLERLRDARTLYLPAEARTSVRAPQLDIAPELEAICVRATETDQADRFASARAVQEAIARFLEGNRDREKRHELAAAHGQAARAALTRMEQPDSDYERERTAAIRELNSALALEPTHADHLATLGQIISSVPRVMPRSVVAEMTDSLEIVVKNGCRAAIISNIMWFGFLPLVMVMGVHSTVEIAVVLGAAVVTATVAWFAANQQTTSLGLQIALVVSMLFGMTAITRSFGTLILAPTMIVTFTIVMQAHPVRRFQRTALVLGALALVLPILLEAIGILPASYRFDAGEMIVVPQMHDFPAGESVAMLVAANFACMLVPAWFVGRLSAQLSDAQRRLLLREWDFRTLRDEVMTRGRADSQPALPA